MHTLKHINALGTAWSIELFESRSDLEHIQKQTEVLLEDFEQKYSRFRDDSWLSELNARGVFENPDTEFVTLLQKSDGYYKATNGVFNIAIGNKMISSGYDSSYSLVAKSPESEELPALSSVLSVSPEKIELRSETIDLGGIGKGFVIDKLAEFYRQEFGLAYFLINGGGDIYATSDQEKPITIMLAHPTDVSLSIGSVLLHNEGFASSSPYLRAWPDRQTGVVHNHLHTKNRVVSYVISNSACEADVWATALAIEPSLTSPEWMSKLLIRDNRIMSRDTMFNLHEDDQRTHLVYH